MTRIAIVGYGAMGRAVERLAPQADANVVAICDIDDPFTPLVAAHADVAVDFTLPHVVPDVVRVACDSGTNLVIGTTGWYDRFDEVASMAAKAGIGLVYGTNFSIGVQMFFRLVRLAAQLAERQPEYDVMLHEWHHKRKKDAPSGTALTAADLVLGQLSRKTRIESETSHDRIDADALHVTSTRGGEIVGKHVLTMDSAVDRIEVTHDAKNRDGFAWGALQAARWINGRTGVYDFADIIDQLETKP
ncbi:MAG: 4-hydroxy-tetrahydrodipicolinate reductase [Candidatus Kapabacteria bacterium]|nr:4-hydroxy-tetrahydrodipicolinate reductase [Candidatus Kapabacteria bacterium]